MSLSDRSRVSLTVAGWLITSVVAGMTAAYSFRDAALADIRREVKTTSEELRSERPDFLRPYATREWVADRVRTELRIELAPVHAKLDRLLERRAR